MPTQNGSPANRIFAICQPHPENGNAGTAQPIGAFVSIGWLRSQYPQIQDVYSLR